MNAKITQYGPYTKQTEATCCECGTKVEGTERMGYGFSGNMVKVGEDTYKCGRCYTKSFKRNSAVYPGA